MGSDEPRTQLLERRGGQLAGLLGQGDVVEHDVVAGSECDRTGDDERDDRSDDGSWAMIEALAEQVAEGNYSEYEMNAAMLAAFERAAEVAGSLLLQALAQRPGFVKSRDQLMDVAYDDQVYVDDRTIDSHIKRLRKKGTAAGGRAGDHLDRYSLGRNAGFFQGGNGFFKHRHQGLSGAHLLFGGGQHQGDQSADHARDRLV